ncbi:unnamed protein product [Bursaphelenchus xylophilus]|uniref:(pine wood nematode) hypothetical protein n=1 Tax=Bursaphelenchus xylophilus TaxID=6326 RepID=A0A7I8X563_BURXY|nr:unnamed protein product [Bursaphelenchus xylophilus]CAG9122533.1 unnamed protein product [Bursaphelenchus xylophilus]
MSNTHIDVKPPLPDEEAPRREEPKPPLLIDRKMLSFVNHPIQKLTIINDSNDPYNVEFRVEGPYFVSLGGTTIRSRAEVILKVEQTEASNGKLFIKYSKDSLEDPKKLFHKAIRLYANIAQDFSCEKPVIQDNTIFYNDRSFSDTMVKCGDTVFHVSRVILSRHSRILQGKFKNDFIESKIGLLKINGFDVRAVELMLRFLYGENIQIGNQGAELMKLANHYQIAPLTEFVSIQIMHGLSADNFYEVLKLAHSIQHDELYRAALECGNERFISFRDR